MDAPTEYRRKAPSAGGPRLAGYVLAADPAWIERCVASWYGIVDEILVSYDASGRGWTGVPVSAEAALRSLRAIDPDGKMRLAPGDFSRPDLHPLEAETEQRRAALAELAGYDWVLQLDGDEQLPDAAALLRVLEHADARGLRAVEWPMRVLFRSLRDGRFLEVCDRDGAPRFEYPGAIAVRPDVELVQARHVAGEFLRPVVAGDTRSLQVTRPLEDGEVRAELVAHDEAILHYSWAGSRARIREKVASWGHADGLRTVLYYQLRWRPAPLLWRTMHDFHPFSRGLWPALKAVELP
jgi:hypothetical protein